MITSASLSRSELKVWAASYCPKWPGWSHLKVEIVGIASGANRLWMSQIGRRATDAVDGILYGKRYLIHDREPVIHGSVSGHSGKR
jgi:hypothetical protein